MPTLANLLLITSLVIASTHSFARTPATIPDETDGNFSVGVSLYRSKRFDTAASSFRIFLQDNPQHPRAALAHLFLALSLSETKEYAESRDYFLKYLKLAPEDPNAAEALYRSGECSFHLQDYPAAVTQLSEFLDRHPQHKLTDWALLLLGDSQLALDQYADSRATLQKIVLNSPLSPVLGEATLSLGRALERLDLPNEALQTYQPISMQKESPLQRTALTRIATLHYKQANYPASLAAWNEYFAASANKPVPETASLGAGMTMYRMQAYEEAIQQLQQQTDNKSVHDEPLNAQPTDLLKRSAITLLLYVLRSRLNPCRDELATTLFTVLRRLRNSTRVIAGGKPLTRIPLVEGTDSPSGNDDTSYLLLKDGTIALCNLREAMNTPGKSFTSAMGSQLHLRDATTSHFGNTVAGDQLTATVSTWSSSNMKIEVFGILTSNLKVDAGAVRKARLEIHVRVKNLDDRRYLHVSRGMASNSALLIDDVANEVRQLKMQISKEEHRFPALQDLDRVKPGESRVGVLIFEVPLPQTEFLILTLPGRLFRHGEDFPTEADMKFLIPFPYLTKVATVRSFLPEVLAAVDSSIACAQQKLAEMERPAKQGRLKEQEPWRSQERLELALNFGGTIQSEAAVESSLRWLASVQSVDGRWDASAYDSGLVKLDENYVDRNYAGRNADTGLTALVVLSFLGAGYTHEQGPYALQVDHALEWLISQQGSNGNLFGDAEHYAAMYCHGIATYALAEAWEMQNAARARSITNRLELSDFMLSAETAAMTDSNTVVAQLLWNLLRLSPTTRIVGAIRAAWGFRRVSDKEQSTAPSGFDAAVIAAANHSISVSPEPASPLRDALIRALTFTMSHQDPVGGGWRYRRGQAGDVSMLGWHLMALKSAEIGGITIPAVVRQRMNMFLNQNSQGNAGGLFGYRRTGTGSTKRFEQPTPTMTAEALFCRQMLGSKPDSPATREAIGLLVRNPPGLSRTNYYYWYYGSLAMCLSGDDAWSRWNQVLRDTLIETQVAAAPFAGSWDPNGPWGRYGGRLYSTALATLTLQVYYRSVKLRPVAYPK